MTDLVLYDDATARGFEPFSLTRPISEMRAGALLVRERWELALGMDVAGAATSPHLADFDEPWGVRAVSGVIRAGSILASSRCAVTLAPAGGGGTAAIWRCGDRVAAVALPRDVDVAELADGQTTLESLARPDAPVVEIRGRWIDHVWDFIGGLAAMLNEDIELLSTRARISSIGIGELVHRVFTENGSVVEPHVHFDTTSGPVYIRKDATVQAFTRIVGPCYIGSGAVVGGDKIAGSSIGDVSKVHGEVSSSVFLGHANKGHDGFLGHSYLGRWVNLGAGTITSNLKNTYGNVNLWTPGGTVDTGLQFLGTLFGDHVKTGIGTSLNTGTVLGSGANVYGSVMPPKAVPPFAWGDHPPYSTYRLDKFIDVARRVMARRHVELSEKQVRQLTAAYERRWSAGKSA